MVDEIWRVNLIHNLTELSSLEQQRQNWIFKSTPFSVSPTELICSVFDDSSILELMEVGTVFSPEADAILKELSGVADAVDVEQPPEALLRDESWLRLTRVAGEAVRAIRGSADANP
jgi:hypothetical protein